MPDRAAGGLRIRAEAATIGPTGVEMEALTAASVAALTVYDMVKGVERGVEIRSVRLRLEDRRQERRVGPTGGAGRGARGRPPVRARATGRAGRIRGRRKGGG